MWATLPWVMLGPLAAMVFRTPRRLPGGASGTTPAAEAPLVTVIVPARNEAANIAACLTSLSEQVYGRFEIVVLDDRSEDGTADVASAMPTGNAQGLRVIRGEPLPDGWFGKPWACAQAAAGAGGEILLFTDADTRHAPDLLARAVAELLDSRADALTLVGMQAMGSFWEGVVQPQVFLLLAARYPDMRTLYDPWLGEAARWRDAIANGQYIMIRREAYDRLGGHEAVRGEVVEDLRLAQVLVQGGGRLAVRDALGGLETRMYRSLAGLVEGWSKNIWTASRQAFPSPIGSIMPALGALGLLAFWVVPPLVLLGGVAAVLTAPSVPLPTAVATSVTVLWSAVVVAASIVFWGAVTWRLGGSPLYAFGYPAGATITAFILLRSWSRGRTIVWKGRIYGAVESGAADGPDGVTGDSGP